MPSGSGVVLSNPSITVEATPDISGVHTEAAPAPELNRPVSTTGNVTKETAALREILRRYEQAYDRLDAPAAAAIWYTVDSRALARAFSLLQYQDLEFRSCSLVMTDSNATAQCPGQLRYTRRVGDASPKVEQHVWMIEFARSGETWRIVGVTAQ